ncbi:aspartate racemase [Secundilactobacillus odoratitofui DSM 19909 = JCM 15043]|uniref:Aspartate racemase n=1 Tax=Secundilactobacillus odoratitofui DSM 19909 = JCM 15043 TaxID=1423776 RepID=A0A0R1LPK5_9LACO|nr:amino acid racemase [Secundilactobacillus odoratitofui]KRK97804.1 aspartate racemase [Secundilactobacillus odoratitofui DSM 19909 = JCM 15043]
MQHFFTIIGGMGTEATETYLHQLNERTPAQRDQDYLDYILVNHATVPDRTAYIKDHSQPNPLPTLLDDIKKQSQLGPDFFALPCNTAHYFYDDLQAATDIPILHMPREAVKSIKTTYPNARKIGLIATEGTIYDHIYDHEILNAGYEFAAPSQSVQEQTNRLIYDNIKDNNVVDRQLYHGLVQQMFDETHCDALVLGCTELSLAQDREPVTDKPMVDSQSILVDRSLELALKYQKGN